MTMLFLVSLGVQPAAAHPVDQAAANGAADAVGMLLLGLLGIAYWRGARRVVHGAAHRKSHIRRNFLFSGAWLALAVALLPPLESLTTVSFAAHMIQHELIMLIAAPLFVLARPHGVLLWGLPAPIAAGIARLTKLRFLRVAAVLAAGPLGAWLIHAVVVWGWHIPVAFEAGLRSTLVHWLQHLCFFVAALLFWWSIIVPGSRLDRTGAALASVFTTMIHTSLLGALLTLSPRPWYATYESTSGVLGLTALEDQQLGGVIMWVPGGLVFLVAGLAVVARWLAAAGASAK